MKEERLTITALKAVGVGDMPDQLELARNRLYGADGLAVSDFKMSAGTSREVSKDQFAEQINRVLTQIDAGDYALVEDKD